MRLVASVECVHSASPMRGTFVAWYFDGREPSLSQTQSTFLA